MTDSRPTACAARPGADQQMRCTRCGFVWDIDDPEPPTCRDTPRIRYGILDDFGEVIRWQGDKPAAHYRYIIDRVKVPPAVDWNNFEPAPF